MNDEERTPFSFQQIVQLARDVIIVTEADPVDPPGPRIVYVNEAFAELTGYSAEEVIGRSPRLLQGDDTDADERARVRAALEAGGPVRSCIRNYGKDGRGYWLDMRIAPLRDDTGRLTHFVAIERDVTASVEATEVLRQQARRDELTDLPNRRCFRERLNAEWRRSLRHEQTFSLALLDVDHFKRINDAYGHAGGDEALAALGALLRTAVREEDIAARVGGEEFAVLMPATGLAGAREAAERIRRAVESAVIDAHGDRIALTVSVGIAEWRPDSTLDPESLMRHADEALYAAKRAGRNRVVRYRPPRERNEA